MRDAESGSIIGEKFVVPHKCLVEIVVPHDCLIRDLPDRVDALDVGRRVEALVYGSWRSGEDGPTSCTQGAAVTQGVYHGVVAIG